MATLTTVLGKNVAALGVDPMPKLDAGVNYGKLRVLYDEYTIAADDEFGTDGLIKLFKLPKGCTLIDFETHMPASGTTGTFQIGWAASLEKKEDGTAVVLADADGIAIVDPGDAAVSAKMLPSADGFMKKFAAEVEVQVDCTEATEDAGGDTYKFKAIIAVE